MNSQLLGGRYQITQVLASGGFGQTYLAADTHRPGHPLCVVKQLRPTNQSPQLMPKIHTWFKNEAETLENLGNHDQIPRLLAYFDENQEFFLVQEYIDAQSLASPRNFQLEEIKQIALSVLEILVYLQYQTPSIIHRDIKPESL